jgi:hypothetical protein
MMPNVITRARAVSIRSELQRRGIKLPKCAGAERSGPCPVCGGDDRFWVNTRRNIWGCRGCGKSAEDIIALVRHLDGVEFHAALATLTDRAAAAHTAAPVRISAEAIRGQHQDDWPRRRALEVWREAVPIAGTVAEHYLRGTRGLELHADVSPRALRFHPRCIFGNDRLPCLVALYRDIETNEPRAVHRTALSLDGRKLDRKALGPTHDAAIKISPDDAVGAGLTVGEGLETTLAGMQLGFTPAWALGCAAGIAKFSVLDDVEVLTILVDRDETGMRAAAECSARWTVAGRTVHRIVPRTEGQDMADLV